ncbi:MAG: NAD(P)-binding domain-containing protein, partial [Ignavibacteriae bacterium]|nr:NAD(P)-binding domain-containing protein [Ignavibacteriota bacterium]
SELLGLWQEVLTQNNITINQNEKVLEIIKYSNYFEVITNQEKYNCLRVLLSIGRRGSPRKLGVPGENLEKVTYRLLEPELINNKKVIVVGGGDSAIESSLLLAEDETNQVTLSYRSASFNRIKPKNLEKIELAKNQNKVNVIYESNIVEINEKDVKMKLKNGSVVPIENDLVYIFAGGELPNKFLDKIGIKITKKYGEVVLKH